MSGMGKPIIILSGQSNAARISDEVTQVLDERFGQGNYIQVNAYSAGAPLTKTRDTKTDWLTPGEMRTQLVDETISALADDPDNFVAGVIWVQGEADTYESTTSSFYDDLFLSLFNEFRSSVSAAFETRYTGIATAPVAISGLSENAPEAQYRQNWNQISDSLEELGASQNWASTVDPDIMADAANLSATEMFSDGLHYSDDFSLLLAEALVDQLVQPSDPGQFVQTGTSGDDVMQGLSAASQMAGGAGDDTYFLDNSDDRIVELSDQGIDHVYSSIETDLRIHSQHLENLTIVGSLDLDVAGNTRANKIAGNDGANQLSGARGNDTLIGSAGNDTLKGNYGGDTLLGGAGKDTLKGGRGGDFLNGGTGNDTLLGGLGRDEFVFKGNFGNDTILDFEAGDLLNVSMIDEIAGFDDLQKNHMEQSGNSVIISDDSGNSVTLNDISVNDLSADDFLF